MRTLAALMVGLSFSIAIPAAYLAPEQPASALKCLSDRAAAVRDAATFLLERAAVIERSPSRNADAARALESIEDRVGDIAASMESMLIAPHSENSLETALRNAATRLAVGRSSVTRLNIALLPATDEAAKVAAREMSTRLEELFALVPAEDPARGCADSGRR